MIFHNASKDCSSYLTWRPHPQARLMIYTAKCFEVAMILERKTPRQSRRARSKDHRRDFSSSEPPIPSASGTKSRRRRPRYERQSAASAATSKQGAIGSVAARSSRPFAGTSFERKDRRLRCSERERGCAAKREIDMGDWASKGTTKSMGGGLGCLEATYLINISIFRACCSDLNATDRA